MKKKIILILTIIGTLIGGTLYIGTNYYVGYDNVNKDIIIRDQNVCLYGCSNSKKNKRKDKINVLQKLWKRN